jgi:hypothetical protein
LRAIRCDTYTDTHCNSYSYRNRHIDANSHGYTYANAMHGEMYANAPATSYSGAPADYVAQAE